MNLSAKKSSIHHHLTSPIFKKLSGLRAKSSDEKAAKVESGFGELQMGTEVLSVPAAYKPIFRI